MQALYEVKTRYCIHPVVLRKNPQKRLPDASRERDFGCEYLLQINHSTKLVKGKDG